MPETIEKLGRFGHHPEAAVDFCCEVEALENIDRNAQLGLTGYGHEADRASLESRIEQAMDFRVGADANAIMAKCALRSLAEAYGFDIVGEIGYAGQPIPRKERPDA